MNWQHRVFTGRPRPSAARDRLLLLLLVQLWLLNVADLALTRYAMWLGFATESNGVMDFFLRAGTVPALAFKIGKVRRACAAGDYPTAYVYPVTDVGRDVAERGLGRTWKQMTAAGAGPTKVVLSRVETRGGYPCPEGRHDIEVRTYAFPVSHTGGDGHLIAAQSPDGDGLPSFPARKRA
jgi:hypothetical protein